MADAESISLEETNKIRISLGLAPLKPVSQDTTTVTDEAGNVVVTADDEERQGVENLKALRAEQGKAAEQEALRQRLKRAKDRKALNERLAGRTLGEADEGNSEDLKSWIKRTKKRERELAEKRSQELENQDQQFQNEYTSEHLEGLRVGHDFADIEEGEGMILTIKDRGVLDEDEEGDELVSTALAEKERLKENLDNKIKKPKYDPYAEEYDADTGEKKLLSKYDEDIEGKKRKTFVLGKAQEAKTQISRDTMQHSNSLTAISLDYDKPLEIGSDYMDPSTIKIKKPKKKKQKNPTRVTALLDDEGLIDINISRSGPPPDNIALVPLTSTKRAHNEDPGLGDDEELQEMLAQRRRQALKRKKVSRPEDIVRNIRLSRDDENPGISENDGLVIDDTSEFVRGLEMSQLEQATPTGLLDNENPPEEMDIDAAGIVKDVEMPDQLPEDIVIESDEIIPSSVLDDEPIVASSLAATLAALKRTGEIAEATISSNFSMEDLEKREEIIARQRTRRIQQEADARRQREQERQNERFNRLSQREKEQLREQENQSRERNEAQQRMREFNDFKFNVDLEYKDEFGQEMTKKDAFKRLSHTFHGKSSGTMKKGKYLQKVIDKMKTTSGSIVGDLTKVDQQRERQKKTGSAYTRIQ